MFFCAAGMCRPETFTCPSCCRTWYCSPQAWCTGRQWQFGPQHCCPRFSCIGHSELLKLVKLGQFQYCSQIMSQIALFESRYLGSKLAFQVSLEGRGRGRGKVKGTSILRKRARDMSRDSATAARAFAPLRNAVAAVEG